MQCLRSARARTSADAAAATGSLEERAAESLGERRPCSAKFSAAADINAAAAATAAATTSAEARRKEREAAGEPAP